MKVTGRTRACAVTSDGNNIRHACGEKRFGDATDGPSLATKRSAGGIRSHDGLFARGPRQFDKASAPERGPKGNCGGEHLRKSDAIWTGGRFERLSGGFPLSPQVNKDGGRGT